MKKMFQMALLLLKGNNCATLFKIHAKNVEVMARINLDGWMDGWMDGRSNELMVMCLFRQNQWLCDFFF